MKELNANVKKTARRGLAVGFHPEYLNYEVHQVPNVHALTVRSAARKMLNNQYELPRKLKAMFNKYR
jgi:hypothetical protein